MQYREHKYWSVIHNGKVARLSIADEHGQEHFAIVPTERLTAAEPKRPWREVRSEALEAIAAHIEAGSMPGEVRV